LRWFDVELNGELLFLGLNNILNLDRSPKFFRVVPPKAIIHLFDVVVFSLIEKLEMSMVNDTVRKLFMHVNSGHNGWLLLVRSQSNIVIMRIKVQYLGVLVLPSLSVDTMEIPDVKAPVGPDLCCDGAPFRFFSSFDTHVADRLILLEFFQVKIILVKLSLFLSDNRQLVIVNILILILKHLFVCV
jgi:hypothetical protein